VELERIELTDTEELQVATRRGLFVERETYQRLSDAGLLPPSTARTLLHEVDDQIEEVNVDHASLASMQHRERPRFDRWVQRFTGWLPEPVGEDPAELAYAEASARRLAARRTGEALELFEHLPGIQASAVTGAKQMFARWEQEAVASLAELDRNVAKNHCALHQRQAAALSRVAATDALDELVEVGLLPEAVARHAAEAVANQVGIT